MRRVILTGALNPASVGGLSLHMPRREIGLDGRGSPSSGGALTAPSSAHRERRDVTLSMREARPHERAPRARGRGGVWRRATRRALL